MCRKPCSCYGLSFIGLFTHMAACGVHAASSGRLSMPQHLPARSPPKILGAQSKERSAPQSQDQEPQQQVLLKTRTAPEPSCFSGCSNAAKGMCSTRLERSIHSNGKKHLKELALPSGPLSQRHKSLNARTTLGTKCHHGHYVVVRTPGLLNHLRQATP